MWRTRASFVGGIFSIDLPFFVKSSFLERFMSTQDIVLSYIKMTNLSGACSDSLLRLPLLVISTKASVASSKAFQVSQAVFLPFPWNADVQSYPVIAWKPNKTLDFRGIKVVAISWTAIYL